MKKGWEKKKLGEVCTFENGDRGKNYPSKSHRVDKGIPFINAGHLINNQIDFQDMDYISEERFNLLGSGKIKSNDMLFCLRGSLGKVANVKNLQKGAIASSLVIIRPKEELNGEFLLYFLNSELTTKQILNFGNGAAQPNLSAGSLKNFIIPIPETVSEQKRIVSKLDKSFDAIEKAKVNAEKNLENSRELFESYLNNIFVNKGEDWQDKTVLELCQGKENVVGGPFGSNMKVKDYKDNGVPIFRLQNIGKGFFIDKDIKYISNAKAEELKYHSFQKGDLVLAKLGIPIGKTCIVPENFPFGIVVADVVRIRPDKKFVDSNYLNYFLNSRTSVSQLTKNISGATRPRVNLNDVRDIIVPIPLLQEQNRIVSQLDSILNKTQKLEKIYQKKTEDLEEMKKSLLQKAFNGEL